MKKILILIIVILCIGYFFREETIVFNIKDTYYVISYFAIATYILYCFVIFWILKFVFDKIKKSNKK
jgi:hypothetical protein